MTSWKRLGKVCQWLTTTHTERTDRPNPRSRYVTLMHGILRERLKQAESPSIGLSETAYFGSFFSEVLHEL